MGVSENNLDRKIPCCRENVEYVFLVANLEDKLNRKKNNTLLIMAYPKVFGFEKEGSHLPRYDHCKLGWMLKTCLWNWSNGLILRNC